MKGTARILAVAVLAFVLAGCATVQITPQQRESIQQAAQKVLPEGAQVTIGTQPRLFSQPDLTIAAHLLEGHASDEQSPYVRGDYGTHEKLTRLVRLRSAKVIKSILDNAQLPDVGGVLVHTMHGVRQSYAGQPFSGNDVPMTLYTVRFGLSTSASGRAHVLSEDDIIRRFKVKRNIIPSLSFSRSWY